VRGGGRGGRGRGEERKKERKRKKKEKKDAGIGGLSDANTANKKLTNRNSLFTVLLPSHILTVI
jgi:hypothetical protein